MSLYDIPENGKSKPTKMVRFNLALGGIFAASWTANGSSDKEHLQVIQLCASSLSLDLPNQHT